MLLRFRTENHRSLRDAAELSLISSHARGSVPADGDWHGFTTRVAGIYGANASGKSNVLDALDFMCSAIEMSATVWGSNDKFPHFPFRLNSTSQAEPSVYELDIVIKEVRYTYGFESTPEGIVSEWLYSYPSRRRRTLFERRSGAEPRFHFGRNLPGENSTISKLVKPTALYLSVAANNNHPVLADIHSALSRNIQYARFTEPDKDARIRLVTKLVQDEEMSRKAQALLRFADLGISGVEPERKSIEGEDRSAMEKIITALHERRGDDGDAPPEMDKVMEELSHEIRFIHTGEEGDDSSRYKLTLEDQSAGTVAWLSIGVPALVSLELGETFMIDELDSSLHPRLTAAVIRMFKDPVVNRTGAQLIFTSHDSSLLGKMLGDILRPEEVWFTEKDADGATELYSLQEFQVRHSDNFELRYLQGRYGAVPMVEPEELRASLAGQVSE